ncbi:MAG: metallo-mystery pair system four-Cys motif protein [Chloroflexi bacterium]|nr:MAG: metallo-mystery pair system four-Cys motif protein [Chloroflexota bacterium]
MRQILSLFFLFCLTIPAFAQDEAEMQPITLYFVATVGNEMASCSQTYTNIGLDEAQISFNDFRLYISNILLITTDGDLVPLQLEQDGLWQVEDVVLLDFEDGTAGCATTGNEALNGEIRGMAPVNDYVGVRFDVGIPFELNHQDVTTAPSPLNIAAMFWSWQGGYKFIRIDLVTDATQNAAWNIHIGSTGCESPAAVIAPTALCARPNITTISFDEFDFENDVIAVDLATLLANIALYENTPMPPGCMSGIDDPDCPLIYQNLGLSLQDGVCPDQDCSSQTFFHLADREDVILLERTDMMMPDESMDESSENHHNHGG